MCKTTIIALCPLPVIYVNDKRSRNCEPIVFFTRPGEANTIPVGSKIRPDNLLTPGTSFSGLKIEHRQITRPTCVGPPIQWRAHEIIEKRFSRSKPLTRHCDVMTAFSACRNLIMTHSCSKLHLETPLKTKQFGQERGQFPFKLPK